jgi:hypothetical protein
MPPHRFSLSHFCLLFTALICLADTRSVLAARLVTVRIERGGEKILEEQFGVPDREGPALIWSRLHTLRLKPHTPIAPSPDNPLEATLSGDLRLVLLHVDRTLAEAKLDRLRLVRAAPGAHEWRLPPEEVVRTAEAAGLELPTDYLPLLVRVGVASFLFLCALIGVWLYLRHRGGFGRRRPEEM